MVTQSTAYLKQCRQTVQLLANKLSLKKNKWRLVFKSRFGRAEWIKPYCVKVLQSLPQEGVQSIGVICPGFSTDCLETLEEIALGSSDAFIQAGGEKYGYIPALNDDVIHIQASYALVCSYSN